MFERAQLRKQVITQFAMGQYEGSILPCKRLIQKARLIYDLKKKRADFYDYLADKLTLVKAYLKIDQVKTAREQLTEDAAEMRLFMQLAKIHTISNSGNSAIQKDAYELNLRDKQEIKKRNDNMNDIRKRCSLIALIASLFYACGDFNNCEKNYVTYVQVIEEGFSQDVFIFDSQKSLEASNCYFLVGVFYLQHKYFIKALACFKRSLSIRISQLGERNESVSDCWYNLAIIYKQTGKKIKAIEYLESTLQLRRELIGDVSLQVAQTLETLGKIYMEEADFKSALVKFEECYKIRRRILNNDQHSDTIRISLLIIHLYTLVREQVLHQTAPKKQQEMLQNLSDHITASLLDKNLNYYLSIAKSHLDLLLLEEKKKEHQRAIGMYDKKQLQNLTLENNLKMIQTEQFIQHDVISDEFSDDGDVKNDNQYEGDDDDDDPKHYLVVDKDLMSTLSLDQLVALQQLYDILKDKYIDPSYEALTDVIRSEFVRSLSHIQFALLKQKNEQLFNENNLETHQFEASRELSASVLVNIAAALDAPHIKQSPYLHAHLLDKSKGLSNEEINHHQQLSAFITPQTHPHIINNNANYFQQGSIKSNGFNQYGQPNAMQNPQYHNDQNIAQGGLYGDLQRGQQQSTGYMVTQSNQQNPQSYGNDGRQVNGQSFINNQNFQQSNPAINIQNVQDNPNGTRQSNHNVILKTEPNDNRQFTENLNVQPLNRPLSQSKFQGGNQQPQTQLPLPFVQSSLNLTDSMPSDTSSNFTIPPPAAQKMLIPPPPPPQRLSIVPIKLDLGPKSKTKQLFWDKTQVDPSKTMWGEKIDTRGFRLDDLDEVFSNMPSRGDKSSYQPVKQDNISLLIDGKKIANINIMLSKFKKFTNDELKIKIISLDKEVLNPESAQTLSQFIPGPEELNNCRDFDGDINQLDQPSKFYLMISQIPNYEARLSNTIFKEDFPNKAKQINSQTSSILRSSDILRRSQSFKTFLKLVLEVGNKMNSGTLKGQADGFKLSSLNQLTQMKSTKGDQTLLQYIVRKLITENQREVLKFSDEFECFKETQLINIKDIQQNYQVLRGSLNKLEATLNLARQTGDRDFIEAFWLLHREATQQINECDINIQNAKREWEETAKFFGEDDEYLKNKTSDEFFKGLFTFNEAVKKAEKSTSLQNKFNGPQSNQNNPNRFN